MRNIFYYPLALLAIIYSCRKTDATTSSTTNALAASLKTIDVNADFTGTNFVNLFTNNKNVLIVSGKDTLCYAVGLTKNDKFISYDDQTGEEATTFTTTGNDELHSMVITATPNAAYINGAYNRKMANVALFNKEQLLTTLHLNPSNNLKATNPSIAKGYIVKNAKMSIAFIHKADVVNDATDAATTSCMVLPPTPSYNSIVQKPVITTNTQVQAQTQGQPTTYQPVNVYKHMNWEDKSAKPQGSDGNVGDIYYTRSNKGYLAFYRLREKNYAKTAMPTIPTNTAGWEFVGPFEWKPIGDKSYASIAGNIFVYDNPFNGKREFFKLKKSPYSWFPIDKKSNEWWEYLGEDCASKITVKLWYEPNNVERTAVSGELTLQLYFAWNVFIEAMRSVTTLFTYIRSYQGMLNLQGNMSKQCDNFNDYLNSHSTKQEKFTIYGFVRYNPDGGSLGTSASSNTYNMGQGGSPNNPIFVISVAGRTNLITLGHEIGHVLGAHHNDVLYYSYTSFYDIMASTAYENRYAIHKDASNISAIKRNLRIPE